jgi:hypothetical protein
MDFIIRVMGSKGHQLPIRHWIRHLDRIGAVRPELPGPHVFSITYRTLDIVGSSTLLDVSKDYRHAIQHPVFNVDVGAVLQHQQRRGKNCFYLSSILSVYSIDV